jgi:hypothetical protein
MALVIRVSKSERAKVQALNSHVTHLCEAMEDDGEDQIYVPVSGKLIDMLKLFYQHDIPYIIQPAKVR